MCRSKGMIIISIISLIVIILSIVNTSCITITRHTDKSQLNQSSSQQALSPDIPKSVTGTINVKPTVDLVTTTVNPSGGTVIVNKQGDPLDGLKIEVPPGAYSDTRTFKISSAFVQNHTFGSDFNPISPLITVDNGGGYSEVPMIVKIPVTIPKGYFAMAFFYDAARQDLEGIPLVDEDSSSITVATGHFSSMVVSIIAENHLDTLIDSNFRPGVDDWQFPNWGSYLEPGGHCSGQSVSAMWYYCEKKLKGAKPLHDLYDNNGNGKTAIWEDDSLGYRLASTVHADSDWNKWLKNLYKIFLIQNPEQTRRMFAYTMMETHEPQYVGIEDPGAGHVMIVYRVGADGTLWVADPNYPGALDRTIKFVNGKYQPYNSGANVQAIQQGQGTSFPWIYYYGKYTFNNPKNIAARWGEFSDKTIGNNGNNKFPTYNLMVVNAMGQKYRLTDGLITTEPELSVIVDPLNEWYLKLFTNIASSNPDIDWNEHTKPMPKIKLKPGKNLLGFAVLGNPPDNPTTKYKYIDFKWVNVYLQTLAIEPATLNGQTNQNYTFTAKIDNPPDWVEYEWYVDGDRKQSGKENQFSYKFNKENTYNISVKLRDPALGGYIGEASAVANIYGVSYSNLSITPSTSTGEPNKDYKFTAMTTNPPGDPIYEWFIDGKSKGVSDKNSIYLKFDTAGRHEIMVTLVDNRAGSTVGRASAVIEIMGKGTLIIGSVPAGADIYINGQKQSSSTNVNYSIEAGTYTVGMKKAGYKDYSAMATVAAGRTTELWAQLEPTESNPSTPKTVPDTGTTRQRVVYCSGSSSIIQHQYNEIKFADGSWVMHGLQTHYYCTPGHHISYTATYVNGKETGTRESYYEDGKHQATGEYVNDRLMKLTYYDSNGRPNQVCTYTWDPYSEKCTYPK